MKSLVNVSVRGDVAARLQAVAIARGVPIRALADLACADLSAVDVAAVRTGTQRLRTTPAQRRAMGDAIFLWLAESGMSTRTLGKRLGVHRDSVVKWMSGKTMPAPRFVERMKAMGFEATRSTR